MFGGGQHQVLRLVVLPSRLAGNPPFLLGRRGEGELPVQLEECLVDKCSGKSSRPSKNKTGVGVGGVDEEARCCCLIKTTGASGLVGWWVGE